MMTPAHVATFTTDRPSYVVHCGSTNVQIGEPFYTDRVALDCARQHDVVHACGPWIEPPLEHPADP